MPIALSLEPGSRKPKHGVHQVQSPHTLYIRPSLTHGGWLGLGTGLLEDVEGRHPQPAWASGKPSVSTKAQRIQGPRDRLQGKTGNINTGCVLQWPSEACAKQRAFPRGVILTCLQEQSTQTEGCEPSLSHRFGPLVLRAGCFCLGTH